MSDSDKKRPNVSPDQGATSATAIMVPKELESEWLQFLKQRKEDKEFDEMEAEYSRLAGKMEILKMEPALQGYQEKQKDEEKELIKCSTKFCILAI